MSALTFRASRSLGESNKTAETQRTPRLRRGLRFVSNKNRGEHLFTPRLAKSELRNLFPFPRFLQLSDLSLDELALQRTHLVEEHNPITVIRFVQHATRG